MPHRSQLRGGGFVFNPVHNIQRGTPVKDLLAMLEAMRGFLA